MIITNTWINLLKAALIGFLLYYLVDNLFFTLGNYYRKYIKIKSVDLQRVKINQVTPEIIELLKEKKEYHVIIFNQMGAFLLKEKR